MKRKYRLPAVQRERTSVECPGTRFPKLSRSATTGRAPFQKEEVAFVSSTTSASARTLTIASPDASSPEAVSAPIKHVLTAFIELYYGFPVSSSANAINASAPGLPKNP